MNRLTTRTSIVTSGLAICGLVAATVLTGCSAGQQSQTAAMEPAVNGTSATVDNIAVRDIRIRAAQTTDEVQPGKTVDLLFVALNQSPDVNDMLVGITTDIGRVTVTGDTKIPANGVLVVGTPEHQDAAPLAEVATAGTAKATVTLTKPISNGLVYNVTFRFAQAGETTTTVPVTAGDEAPRLQQHAPGGEPH